MIETKLRGGNYYVPVKITEENERLLLHFDYNPELLEEVKTSFEGRKYHGFIPGDGRKLWSIPQTQHNLFQLEALKGKYGNNPYARWEQPLDEQAVIDYLEKRGIKPFSHQVNLIAQALKYRAVIWAAEMGLGKTFSAIITMEMIDLPPGLDIWVGPKSALYAAELEFYKWKSPVRPEFYTYEGFKKLVENWPNDKPAPRRLILDESSRCKTPTSQRTVAVRHCTDSMRDEYGDELLIIEMSGSPAPTTPSDWYAQCEIAQPGFVKEGNIHVFRQRVGLFEVGESPTGNYQKLVTWLDDSNKCSICGKLESHPDHQSDLLASIYGGSVAHKFKPSVNEVRNLNRRLTGLVNVKLKKDCLDIPPLRYKTFKCEPAQDTLNAARLIVKSTSRAVDALIKLRTLSDGFLYKEVGTGKFTICPGCHGSGVQKEYVDLDDPDDPITQEEAQLGVRFVWDDVPIDDDVTEFETLLKDKKPIRVGSRDIPCYTCEGQREIELMERVLDEVECPKDDVLLNLLDLHEEVGRFNVYAAFQGSVDRVCRIVQQQGWSYLRADGRGWIFNDRVSGQLQMTGAEMLQIFQENKLNHPKVCFIGQPGAAGMGLTLTASPGTFFFSNDYQPEHRLQAASRGHRIGMDVERGGWIYDVLHLPSDEKVLAALKRSEGLQHLSLTGVNLRDIYGVD